METLKEEKAVSKKILLKTIPDKTLRMCFKKMPRGHFYKFSTKSD